MPTYVSKFFVIAVVVIIGTTLFMGNTNSVKSAMSNMLSDTVTRIESVTK